MTMNVDERNFLFLMTTVVQIEQHLALCPADDCAVHNALNSNAATHAIKAIQSLNGDIISLLKNESTKEEARNVLVDLIDHVSDAIESVSIDAAALLTRQACLNAVKFVRDIESRRDVSKN